jgi:hypothetical protein
VPVVLFPSDASFPCNKARSASTSIFSRPAQRLLALQPAHSPSHLVTLSTGGFSRVVAFPTAPIATGRNDPCREGLAPSQEPRLSTAHLIRDLPGDRLGCPRHRRDAQASSPTWHQHRDARTTRLHVRIGLARPHEGSRLPRQSRPPHPRPTYRDDRAYAPLGEAGCA